MSKTEIMNSLSRTVGRAGLKLKKHSPEILVFSGIASLIGAGVMACKATTKFDEVMAESQEKVDQINAYVEEKGYSEEYTEKDHSKDLAIMKVKSGLKIAKLYGPSIALGTLGTVSILAGTNILKKRNAALAAAYTVVDKSFKDYRSRVVDRFGKDLDRELRYNIKATEVEETVIDEKTGKEKTVKKTVEVVDGSTIDKYSPYAKFFCEGCIGWDKNAEYNRMFLHRQQDFFNDRLKAKGHVFLNEVYDALGIDRTEAGQIVGWVYDEVNPVGDNYIDFGMLNINSEAARRFANGIEPRILLDFNVDGPILEYI